MNNIFLFFRFYFQAYGKAGIHSPFVYQFIENIVEDDRTFYGFDEIDQIHQRLKLDKNSIELIDYGAGSKKNTGEGRVPVNKIAMTSVSIAYKLRMLFRLVDFTKAKNIMELGTSLGISSAYLAKAAQTGRVYSIEGDPSLSSIASGVHSELQLNNTELICGNFKQQLPIVLNKEKTWDLVFIDGHHTYEASIEYFNTILPYLHEHSCVIFDDIYWSNGMIKAWKELSLRTDVSLSIDLYIIGVLFFKKEFKEKQAFKIRPSLKGLMQN